MQTTDQRREYAKYYSMWRIYVCIWNRRIKRSSGSVLRIACDGERLLFPLCYASCCWVVKQLCLCAASMVTHMTWLGRLFVSGCFNGWCWGWMMWRWYCVGWMNAMSEEHWEYSFWAEKPQVSCQLLFQSVQQPLTQPSTTASLLGLVDPVLIFFPSGFH